MRKGGIGYKGGLILTLLLFNLSTVGIIDAKAETVDDLRAYIGKDVKVRSVIDDDIGREAEKTKGNTVIDSDKADIEKQIIELENKYIEGLKSNASAKDVVGLMVSIRDNKDKLIEMENVKKVVNNTNVNDLVNSSRDAIDAVNNGDKLGSYKYNIGSIGDMAIVPTRGMLHIESPFGYKVNDNGTHERKNNYIELGIPYGNDVVSQWNGKVVFIEDDEIKGCKVVTIFHGQGLYTVYHHIELGNIYVGKSVNQGEVIGKAGNTAKGNKGNYIKYQVILDGEVINPLIIFGDRGKKVYEDWARGTREVYTVEEGEEFYYNKGLSKVNPNSDIGNRNSVKGAAEVVGEYNKPDPGVVR